MNFTEGRFSRGGNIWDTRGPADPAALRPLTAAYTFWSLPDKYALAKDNRIISISISKEKDSAVA